MSQDESDEQKLYDELMDVRMQNMQKMREIKESDVYRELHDMLETRDAGKNDDAERYEGNYLLQDAIRNPNSRTECVINELAAAEVADDAEYRALITEIDDAKYDVKDDAKVDKILAPEYFESVKYPQVDQRVFSENVLKSQLPFDVQSVLTDFSQSTQVSMRPPLLSADAQRVFSRFQNTSAEETINMEVPDDDYIKQQRNERLLKSRLDAIDSTLSFLNADQQVGALTKEQIRPFLVEFYADPANFGSVFKDEDGSIQCSRSEEDQRRLDDILKQIRAQAEVLEQGVTAEQHGGAALEGLVDEIRAEQEQINQNLASATQQLAVETGQRKANEREFALKQQESSVLAKVDELIQRKQPAGPLKRVASAKGSQQSCNGERPTSARIRDILGKIQ